MLEDVDTISTDGQLYRWGDYIANMVKTVCERCQEMGGIIKFPSLTLWIVMYHICREGSLVFQEPTRFYMWRFKPFSQRGTLQELERGKVLLENWFQQLKVHMTRWRVPQNIWKKSIDELPHLARARPYIGVVHSGRQLKFQSPRLLSISQPDILGTISTG